MTLPFSPACLPLLLGGLPYRSVTQALDISRRYAGTLLAWPQLPQRGFREQGFVQSAIGFPGLVIDAPQSRVYVDRARAEHMLDRLGLDYLENDCAGHGLAPDDAAALAEILRQGEAPRGTLALKGQQFGPISLAAQLTDEHERPLIYDEPLFEALTQHLGLRAAWQEARLGELSGTTIVCLDEPFLEAVGLPFMPIDWEHARERIDQTLAGIQGCRAIYCGGAVEWAQVLQTSVDLIIADVYEHSAALIAAAPALRDFLDRGGVSGLGIVPADAEALEQESAERLVSRIVALAGDLERAGVPSEQLLRQALIAPANTLISLSTADAEHALQLVDEVSKLLREQYKLA
ncbi:MAG TPA: hypothetical protein VKE41_21085 [Roseiflexaceae bacterium]|nr:hypothetical protein [Roseiflexaceae bacterium]